MDKKFRGKIAGWCGVLAPTITLSLIILSILTSPSFDISTNTLSKLAVSEFIPSILFNLGLIVGGILLIPFSIKIYKSMKEEKILGPIISVIGLELILLGLFAAGHPLHIYLAVILFTFIPVILLLLGISKIRKNELTGGEIEIFSGAAIIAIWVLPWEFIGLKELLVVLITSAWIIKNSFSFLKNNKEK